MTAEQGTHGPQHNSSYCSAGCISAVAASCGRPATFSFHSRPPTLVCTCVVACQQGEGGGEEGDEGAEPKEPPPPPPEPAEDPYEFKQRDVAFIELGWVGGQMLLPSPQRLALAWYAPAYGMVGKHPPPCQ
jgi:hypothetical protein